MKNVSLENWHATVQASIHGLESTDRESERALLARFASFWANAIGDSRTVFDTFIADTPAAPGVAFEGVNVEGASGWWCDPSSARSERAILYVHGGAYVAGSAKAYRGFVSQIAKRTQVRTFVLDYPLAPEHPLPAALNCVAGAFGWLATQGIQEIALVGDSAGGGLVLATLGVGPPDVPRIAACVAFSPWIDLALTGDTMWSPRVQDPLLTREYLAESAAQYLGGADARDPRASPLYGAFAVKPPILIQAGTMEVLLDDARRYAAHAASHGIHVRLDLWEDLHHVFQLSVAELASSRRALDEAALFLVGCFL